VFFSLFFFLSFSLSLSSLYVVNFFIVNKEEGREDKRSEEEEEEEIREEEALFVLLFFQSSVFRSFSLSSRVFCARALVLSLSLSLSLSLLKVVLLFFHWKRHFEFHRRRNTNSFRHDGGRVLANAQRPARANAFNHGRVGPVRLVPSLATSAELCRFEVRRTRAMVLPQKLPPRVQHVR
jgi:hypothetical protein